MESWWDFDPQVPVRRRKGFQGLHSGGSILSRHGRLNLVHAPADRCADAGSDHPHDKDPRHPRQPFGGSAGPGEGHDRCVAGDGGDQENQGECIVGGVKESGEGESVQETEHGTDFGAADH